MKTLKKSSLNIPSMNILILLLMIGTMPGCKKNEQATYVNRVISDAQEIGLKEVSIDGIVLPWLKFRYDTANYVTTIDHDAGSFTYKPAYLNGQIVKMTNNNFMEKDTFLYFYTHNQVSRIDWRDAANGKRQEIKLYYDGSGKLTEMTWQKTNASVLFKRMLFYYNLQNNMIRCDIFYDLGNGLQETNRYLFEDFDDKKNVCPNELLKEYHLYFLPQVRLQQNNPHNAMLLGIESDFAFNYSYEYHGTLPVMKRTVMTQTRGPNAGLSITGVTRFTYY